MASNYPDEDRFLNDIAQHTMTIVRDDGLHRHLQFRGERSMYWFDVVTWPGRLTIDGDMGTFVFARVEDMFKWFRDGRDINPDYWSEKLRAHSGYEEYSESTFRQLLDEHTESVCEDLTKAEAAAFRAAVKAEILDAGETYSEHWARQAVADFVYHPPAPVAPGPVNQKLHGYRFNVWDWGSFTDWTAQYLWSCRAIRHAIAAYDASKAPTLAAVPASAES